MPAKRPLTGLDILRRVIPGPCYEHIELPSFRIRGEECHMVYVRTSRTGDISGAMGIQRLDVGIGEMALRDWRAPDAADPNFVNIGKRFEDTVPTAERRGRIPVVLIQGKPGRGDPLGFLYRATARGEALKIFERLARTWQEMLYCFEIHKQSISFARDGLLFHPANTLSKSENIQELERSFQDLQKLRRIARRADLREVVLRELRAANRSIDCASVRALNE